jgi:hypothetical protein
MSRIEMKNVVTRQVDFAKCWFDLEHSFSPHETKRFFVRLWETTIENEMPKFRLAPGMLKASNEGVVLAENTPFRPVRLEAVDTDASAFDLESFVIGNMEQTIATTERGIPLQSVCDADTLIMVTAQVGQIIRVQIKNTANAQKRLHVRVHGKALQKEMS